MSVHTDFTATGVDVVVMAHGPRPALTDRQMELEK